MSPPGSRQQPPYLRSWSHYSGWVRFIIGYGAVGLAVATVLVWLIPGWLYSSLPQTGMPSAQDTREKSSSSGILGDNIQTKQDCCRGSYAASVARAAPAVVNIYTTPSGGEPFSPQGLRNPLLEHFFENPGVTSPRIPHHQGNLGSGIIINANGYIVTNHHVIKQAESIKVVLADKREAQASIIGEDPATDLAVLKIELSNLPVISFGHETEVKVGDVALAIGNPFGVGQTVTKGIISATGRDELGISIFESFLQTDAAINIGNSGGALIDAQGRLIGINTALFDQGGGASHGIGFAIPASMAHSVISDILKHGRVRRGWLGIKTQRLTPPLARSFGMEQSKGVVVTKTFTGGPVDNGTLRTGDVLIKINETEIEDIQDVLRTTGSNPPGATVVVKGYRDREPFTKEITLGERPEQDRATNPGAAASPFRN